MKKIIFRKPFITVDDRKYGSLMYDMAQHWITMLNYVEDEDVRQVCKETGEMYLDKARRNLGFMSVEDMNRYYEKYRRF